MPEMALAEPGPLPVGPIGRSGMGWWGVGMLVISEAALFGYLLFSYYYLAVAAPPGWLLEPVPKLMPALPNTILLLASSVAAWWGEKGVETGNGRRALVGIGLAFVMGAVFAGVQGYEWWDKPYAFASSTYASLYFTTTGFHMAHILAGLMILAALFAWVAFDFFSPRRRITVAAGILYWHFVDAVWLLVFTTYYLTPYLGFGQ